MASRREGATEGLLETDEVNWPTPEDRSRLRQLHTSLTSNKAHKLSVYAVHLAALFYTISFSF